MKLSVIIPVRNGGKDFEQCLLALINGARPADEIIVVDDGSTDRSADVARRLGAFVVRQERAPQGPAQARNRGAALAHGNVLVFIDADVVVHSDTLARIEDYFAANPALSALFGSYDNNPPAKSLAARYKNLQHHFVHQHGKREASTFWAGCGAIRRSVFMQAGGFNTAYNRPSIEDIELGVRLRQMQQTIWLCPDVQVTHLKRWKLLTLLRTDIWDRAIPWTRLILTTAQLPCDLNLDMRSRLSAVIIWACLGSLALAYWLPWTWVLACLALVGLFVLNLDLYTFFLERGGLGLAFGGFWLHALYFLYSSLVFGAMLVWYEARGEVRKQR